MDFIIELNDIGILIYIFKLLIISIFSYKTFFKIINKKEGTIFCKIRNYIIITITSILCGMLKYYINIWICILMLVIIISILLANETNTNILYSSIIFTISLGINYGIFLVATAISFFPAAFFNIINKYINFIIITVIYLIIWFWIQKMKRFKNGLIFLQTKISDESLDIFILNACTIVIIGNIILSNYNLIVSRSVVVTLILIAIIMFITIQKSLQIYYKQKLLVQELEETKSELEKKNKEIKELEQENLNFSKTSHTLAHKQKALEYKLNQLINQSAENELNKNNTNASKENNTTNQANKPENIETEQIQDIKERLAEISKDLYQNEKSTRLAQTGIKRIDDMLEYMQSESEKYNIKLELQITGNIHHMTNKIIEEKDLETLIADHVKNAIIAINHSKNENKSILVKLGKIEENYGLAIYDTGIEFEKETLENLGKKPSTTHAEEGGTGIGFMNTFDTINKYKASLIINEIGKESETNYTKAIIIKFDQKNEFKIDSYRQQKSTRTAKK